MKNRSVISFILLVVLGGCTSNSSSQETSSQIYTKKQQQSEPKEEQAPEFKVNGKDTLYAVDAFNQHVFWDLKYATKDNFMHRILYDTLTKVYVQKEVAERLGKIQDYLDRGNTGLHLLVYDGLRPLSVQQEMWDALDSIPPIERGKFVSNPKNGSVHNYGCAVDITLCDTDKHPLDMGAGYDDIRKIAYPSLESQFLASGELTEKQVANRMQLRKVMRAQGFTNIPSEWWHFNAYPRIVAKRIFTMVLNEL